MLDGDKKDFLLLFSPLMSVYMMKPSRENLSVYWKALRGFELSDIKEGVEQWLATPLDPLTRFIRFPPPSIFVSFSIRAKEKRLFALREFKMQQEHSETKESNLYPQQVSFMEKLNAEYDAEVAKGSVLSKTEYCKLKIKAIMPRIRRTIILKK